MHNLIHTYIHIYITKQNAGDIIIKRLKGNRIEIWNYLAAKHNDIRIIKIYLYTLYIYISICILY